VQSSDCYQNERGQGESGTENLYTEDVDAFATLQQRCCYSDQVSISF